MITVQDALAITPETMEWDEQGFLIGMPDQMKAQVICRAKTMRETSDQEWFVLIKKPGHQVLLHVGDYWQFSGDIKGRDERALLLIKGWLIDELRWELGG